MISAVAPAPGSLRMFLTDLLFTILAGRGLGVCPVFSCLLTDPWDPVQIRRARLTQDQGRLPHRQPDEFHAFTYLGLADAYSLYGLCGTCEGRLDYTLLVASHAQCARGRPVKWQKDWF